MMQKALTEIGSVPLSPKEKQNRILPSAIKRFLAMRPDSACLLIACLFASGTVKRKRRGKGSFQSFCCLILPQPAFISRFQGEGELGS